MRHKRLFDVSKYVNTLIIVKPVYICQVHLPDLFCIPGGGGVPPHLDHVQLHLPRQLFQSVLTVLPPPVLPLPGGLSTIISGTPIHIPEPNPAGEQ